MSSSRQLQRSTGADKPCDVIMYRDSDYDYIKATQTVRADGKRFNIHISWFAIAVLIGLATGRLRLVLPPGNPLTEALPVWLAEVEPQPAVSAGDRLNETGRVFSDIDHRYLDDTDLKALYEDQQYSYEELLGYAINGVYAEHGLNYQNNAKYQGFFGKFQWYQPDTFNTEEVTDRFNRYEAANIRFLAEKRDQFRE